LEDIRIHTDYITLGQFLKLSGAIDTGGQAKVFLTQPDVVKVNGEPEQRRGKKLVDQDVVSIRSLGEFRVVRQ
jgi:ribosome-associated protein